MWKLFLEMTIYGPPLAKGRPRFLRTGVTYTPSATKKRMMRIAAFMLTEMKVQGLKPIPSKLPVRTEMIFVHPRPKNRQRRKDPSERILKVTKPDGDNLEKLIWDAAKGVLWCDDSQVCEWSGKDYYAAMKEPKKPEEPKTILTVWHWTDLE